MRIALTVMFCTATAAFAGHGILLVSDQVDGVTNPEDFDRYYEDAIREAGYTYAKWDHAARGDVPFEELSKYSLVIWFTSTSGASPASDPLRGNLTLSLTEQAALERFLAEPEGTTAVVLSGMYIAWNCVADATTEQQLYKPLFSDYLKLAYPADNFDRWFKVERNWKYRGENGDPLFQGKSYGIAWRHNANYPDQLEPAAGGAPSAWWLDPDNVQHHRAVIRANGAKDNGGDWRIALFACPFENIYYAADRTTIMKNIIAWSGAVAAKATAPESFGRIKALFP